MENIQPYQTKNKIRIVTATSLFDGHDVAINIMRHILQASGAEVIHLGHNRSAQEVVTCAIQEDANAIAVTSYQGGHMEYFKYMYDLLKVESCESILIFGGGGGVILPGEMEELHQYGIARIYSPDDGRLMGLQGMINDVLKRSDYPVGKDLNSEVEAIGGRNPRAIARLISAAENFPSQFKKKFKTIQKRIGDKKIPLLGVTGTGGSGKSSLIDEWVRRFLNDFHDKNIAILSVDPTKRKTGGALLGDRIRMNSINDPRVYMRSMATREANVALSAHIGDAIQILKAAAFDLIILETSGIGQSDTEITEFADISLYVMTPEYGAATQLEKIDMLDFSDVIAINKFDKRGAVDALRDVRKQYKQNRRLWETADHDLPIFGTIASQFNDPGINALYKKVMEKIALLVGSDLTSRIVLTEKGARKISIIPPERTLYLSEITKTIRNYDKWVDEQVRVAQELDGIDQALKALKESEEFSEETLGHLMMAYEKTEKKLDSENRKILSQWPQKVWAYKQDVQTFKVRDRDIEVEAYTESLAHLKIPKVSLPKYAAWGDILKWSLQENVPGEFPYTAGVFPFKRETEDPTRMFAGEGGPEQTNRRFHYISKEMPAKRLSTAFDSVTLYGDNPDRRPDIYGKIGNSGVSICCLDDAKKLYSGFNLVDPMTSVSMTINGPAPMAAAFFMNTAIDQQCELFIKENGLQKSIESKIEDFFRKKEMKAPKYSGDLPEGHDGLGLILLGVSGDQVLPKETYEKIKMDTLTKVRGTVQADILKEDQAQNTCIFSTEFALKLMGDMQEYFIEQNIRNFYSVSISGYHIAEAGANPITQLAFTLANAFTYVEYYLSRGMNIDDFAPNLSFFFSNGIDPEYAVIGRVARRIWAKAMKYKYHANERSQKLKYHIQTSGRSLHAQEIAFNEIRTTLQAIYAIFDNCNSLHTNAYDEAITTPTEESVRRAMAIQLIINQEMGLAKNQNPLQGSFIVEELTNLVEEAVLMEFDRITERGGVLGAMERMYQRSKIQEESLYYETLKHTGEYPIVGVNTFLSSKGSPTIIPQEIIRSTEEQKESQIKTLCELHQRNNTIASVKLESLQRAAAQNRNVFAEMMETAKYCSLGQMTQALYEVGGQYRRSM